MSTATLLFLLKSVSFFMICFKKRYKCRPERNKNKSPICLMMMTAFKSTIGRPSSTYLNVNVFGFSLNSRILRLGSLRIFRGLHQAGILRKSLKAWLGFKILSILSFFYPYGTFITEIVLLKRFLSISNWFRFSKVQHVWFFDNEFSPKLQKRKSIF